MMLKPDASILPQFYLPAQGKTFMTVGADEINIRIPGRTAYFEGDMKSVLIAAGGTGIYFAFRLDALGLFS